jgi:hypothetical protein
MDSPVAQRFASRFQPQQQSHVLWMKRVVHTLGDRKVNIVDVINSNPMGVEITESDIMDIVFIQFSLAMKYTKAILDGEAWVPPQRA